MRKNVLFLKKNNIIKYVNEKNKRFYTIENNNKNILPPNVPTTYEEEDPSDLYIHPHHVRKYHPPIKTGKKGIDIVHDPLYNKGTGFKVIERDRLGLRGLVPPRRLSMSIQLKKLYEMYKEENDPLKKNIFLCDLQNRNETLFFRLLIENIEEMAPIVYTPTVGLVCQKFGSTFRRPRGMYFSSNDRSQFGAMVHNWPCDDVEIIVVTDGSRILGLGDLGANGMGIPIGKLALYTAGGGIDPRKVLPVMLDCGTNNDTLLNDPYYFGMIHKRLKNEQYWSMIDEFMRSIRHRWPNALIQFEDFSSDVAADILHSYRLKQLCFNDDIQGTGATVLAGALSACRIAKNSLKHQKIIVLGAGSAGLGVATTLLQGMIQEGLTTKEAQNNFYVFDQFGLLTKKRNNLNSGQSFFSRDDIHDNLNILDVIKKIKPTMIVGLSASKGAFTKEIITTMYQENKLNNNNNKQKDIIIFPLSNPTSVAECTAIEAYEWTEGNCIFASGSPMDPVLYNNKLYKISQCNNMFIFPAVGLASTVCQASRVTDRMLYAGAKALSESLSQEEIDNGQVFPSVKNIRNVSLKVATAIMKNAMEDNIATKYPKIRKGASLENYIASKMFVPSYHALV